MYEFGRGVPQDYAQAVQWYRKAADQGVPEAQLKLGNMYYEGQGVQKDDVQAHVWWNLAAAAGIESAKENRDRITPSMTPAQVTKAHKLAREWKPKVYVPK
jgi:TPR repeat protein